jgi:hypothetical protein
LNIQFVQLCSAPKIFSCCMTMCPPTKLQVFANFRPPKNITTLYPPPNTVWIYLCQNIFCSPSWKWS